MSEWISVNDCLPLLTGRYFAVFSCDYYCDGILGGEVFFRADTKMFYLEESRTPIVDKWTSLPELPQ